MWFLVDILDGTLMYVDLVFEMIFKIFIQKDVDKDGCYRIIVGYTN